MDYEPSTYSKVKMLTGMQADSLEHISLYLEIEDLDIAVLLLRAVADESSDH